MFPGGKLPSFMTLRQSWRPSTLLIITLGPVSEVLLSLSAPSTRIPFLVHCSLPSTKPRSLGRRCRAYDGFWLLPLTTKLAADCPWPVRNRTRRSHGLIEAAVTKHQIKHEENTV